MRIIVAHRETGARGLLIGTGFGAYQSERGSAFLAELNPVTKTGQYKTICITNPGGDFVWVNSADYRIVEINGESPGEYFGNHL